MGERGACRARDAVVWREPRTYGRSITAVRLKTGAIHSWFYGEYADAKKSIDSHFPRLADADLH